MEQQALRAACAVARDHDLPCEQATVAYSGSNVLIHLRPSPVVARVMTGTVVLHEDPEAWLKREVSVLSFLAPSRLAVAPSPLIPPGPYRSDGLWMTFWEWVAHRGSELRDGAERLGRALRELHDELSAYPSELGDLEDLQGSIDRLLQQLRPTEALTAERIDSLRERLFALSDTLFAAPLPVQALHGDASLSNLLCAEGRLVWNDFEDTFRGPVHWDLAGYLISLEARGAEPAFVARALEAYGGVERSELAPFTAAHEVYDEIWGLYDAQRRGPDSSP
jgi:aminoglycoside phosphotransferase